MPLHRSQCRTHRTSPTPHQLADRSDLKVAPHFASAALNTIANSFRLLQHPGLYDANSPTIHFLFSAPTALFFRGKHE